LEGVDNGFSIVDRDIPLDTQTIWQCNHRSALEMREAVETQLRIEIDNGNYGICGSNTKSTIVSALGAVPKPDGSIRLIHDASLPVNAGLNSYVRDSSCTYMDLDDACQYIKPGSYLAKVDLKSAYRSVNLCKSNYNLTGLSWKFAGDSHVTYLYDKKLPFGSAKAPQIFQRLSSAVCRIMKNRYGFTVLAYLDDFLVIEENFNRCLQGMNTLLIVLRELGFYINWNKVEGPSQSLIYLGIIINTCNLTLSLPNAKMTDFMAVVNSFATKTRASKRELDSLIGKLNWACRVVKGGRTFLRRMIDCHNQLRKSSHKLKLSADFFKDIAWWQSFMCVFNGTVSFMDNRPITSLQTDACDEGGAGYYNGDFFYVNWSLDMPHVKNSHINFKETLSIIIALERWAPHFANNHVIVFTDNMSAKAAINKGSSRIDGIMDSLRHLFWLGAWYNFTVKAVYIPGRNNLVADTLSRLHTPGKFELFYDLVPTYQLGLMPFNMIELLQHMSKVFISSRWPQTGLAGDVGRFGVDLPRQGMG